MQYLVSGQVGVLAHVGTQPQLATIDDPTPRYAPVSTILELLRSASDVQQLSADTAPLDLLERAWRGDRALRLFLIALTPDQTSEELTECCDSLEELLTHPGTADSIASELLSRPLPVTISSEQRTHFEGFPLSSAILDEVLSSQHIVTLVRDALATVADELFGDVEDRAAFEEAATRAGAFSSLVRAIASESSLDAPVFSLLANFRTFPNGRQIIQAWSTNLRSLINAPRPKRPLVLPEEEDSYDEFEAKTGEEGWRAFESVRKQQAGVTEKLRAGNEQAARAFARQLVEEQRSTSTPLQIAKSLSLLSQRAKELGYFELQLEWARWATEFAPDDARALGHVADALIQVARYVEAEEALDKTAAAGDLAFALNGKARILRATGQLEAARELYLRLRQDFAGDPSEQLGWAGAAEILRDMGMLDEALAEYLEALQKFPEHPVLHSGTAATLTELGRFDEALKHYSIAIELDPEGVVPRNGYATVHKEAGRLTQALRTYDQIIQLFPKDVTARCGRADVLRMAGRLNEALSAYREIIDLFPRAAVAYGGQSDVLLESGRIEQAAASFQEGMILFPRDARFANGAARALLLMGEFETALTLYDQTSAAFPYNTQARLGRAKAFKRLRRFDEALDAYTALMEVPAAIAHATVGKVSTLMALGEYDEAFSLVPASYQTEADWVGCFLREVILLRLRKVTGLDSLMEKAAAVPFARIRRMMKNYAATVRLKQQRFSDALSLTEPTPGEVSEVIYLHAVAGSGRLQSARQIFTTIQTEKRPSYYRELAAQVARRFTVIPGGADKSIETITEAEGDSLILEAA